MLRMTLNILSEYTRDALQLPIKFKKIVQNQNIYFLIVLQVIKSKTMFQTIHVIKALSNHLLTILQFYSPIKPLCQMNKTASKSGSTLQITTNSQTTAELKNCKIKTMSFAYFGF